MSVRIGIVGDYNPRFEAHTTTDSSLRDAAESLGLALEARWLPTPSLIGPRLGETLAGKWRVEGTLCGMAR